MSLARNNIHIIKTNDSKWKTLCSALILNFCWSVTPGVSSIQVEAINEKGLINYVQAS